MLDGKLLEVLSAAQGYALALPERFGSQPKEQLLAGHREFIAVIYDFTPEAERMRKVAFLAARLNGEPLFTSGVDDSGWRYNVFRAFPRRRLYRIGETPYINLINRLTLERHVFSFTPSEMEQRIGVYLPLVPNVFDEIMFCFSLTLLEDGHVRYCCSGGHTSSNRMGIVESYEDPLFFSGESNILVEIFIPQRGMTFGIDGPTVEDYMRNNLDVMDQLIFEFEDIRQSVLKLISLGNPSNISTERQEGEQVDGWYVSAVPLTNVEASQLVVLPSKYLDRIAERMGNAG